MRILVDADALPADAKRILFRAAERLQIEICLVANKALRVPDSPLFSSVLVGAGADVADNWIVEEVAAGDLVVTADIPLASRVVDKGGCALDPRGELYTDQNVKDRLATRNLMDDLRSSNALQGGGPAPFSKKDAQKFATKLDAYLVRGRAQGSLPGTERV